MKSTMVKLVMLLTMIFAGTAETFAQRFWTKDLNNPVLSPAGPGLWDSEILVPWVIYNPDSSRYEMWYTGTLPPGNIGFAVSYDGMIWIKDSLPVMIPTPGEWDSLEIYVPSVIRENGEYKMWYTGNSKKVEGRPLNRIGYATSLDGRNWTKYEYNPIIVPGAEWEMDAVEYCCVLRIAEGYRMFYGGRNGTTSRIGRAFSEDGINWQSDDDINPVLTGGPESWDLGNVFLPRVLEIGNTYYMYYTAHNESGLNWAFGLAISNDSGRTWTKYSGNPVLERGVSGSWEASYIELGSVLLIGNTIHMWYDGGRYYSGSYNGRVGHATAPAFGPLLSQASLDFGNILEGETKTDSVRINNPYTSELTIFSADSDSPEQFEITPSSVVIPANDSAAFYITFHPTSTGTHIGHVSFIHDKEHSPTILDLSGKCVSPSVVFNVDAAWNMVSLPVEPSSFDKVTLFTESISPAYTFNNGYDQKDTLSNGVGYWLKYDSPQNVEIFGNVIFTDSFDVRVGWNMIGSITEPVPVSSIGSDPPGIITNEFFGYTSAGGYSFADSIRPGNGYWVKASETGKLILSSLGNVPKSSRIKIIASSELPPSPPDEILSGSGKSIPIEYSLGQNYPNPFNPTTRISFVIGEPTGAARSGVQVGQLSFVSLKVFNVLGKEVATLMNETKQPGEYSVQWDAGNLPSGVYYYTLRAGSYRSTRKLVLIR